MKYIKKYTNTFIYILMGILSLSLILYIFKGSKAWLNGDSCFIVDYAIDVVKSGSLFPNTWINSNDFWVYSLIPFIAIFIKMGFSLFISRQLGVFVQTILFFLVLYDLYKNCFKDKDGLKIVFLLLLSGVSGQFLFEMFGDATYGTVIFYMLIGLWLYIRYQIKYELKYIILFGIFLTIITSCSLRFPIYIGAPIICSLLYVFYNKGFKKEYINFFIVVIASIGLGFIINTILKNTLLYSNGYEAIKPITEYESLENSFLSFIYNYLFVSGALGRNTFSLSNYLDNAFISNTSSPLIVLLFVRYIFAIISICIPFHLLRKWKKLSELEQTLLLFTLAFSGIIVFFIIIGNMTWYRYVTPMIFFLILLFPLYYKYTFKSKEKNRIVFSLAILAFVFTSFVFCTFSFFSFKQLHFRKNEYQDLADFLVSKDLSFGYLLADEDFCMYNTLTNGKLQIVSVDQEVKHQTQWLSSTRWVEKDYHKGKVFLMRIKDHDPYDFEDKAIEKYEYGHRIIFVFEDNNIILDRLEK